jgi:hypothetical protein
MRGERGVLASIFMVSEKYANFSNFIFGVVLPDGLPAREAVTS